MSRVARATIHTDALVHNLGVVRERAPGARAIAVLKADAYGHGLRRAAAALAGADAFAVSCLAEALPLREAGHDHRIVLLEGFFDADEIEDFAHQRLDAVIHAPWQVECLERAAPSRPLDVWIKVDSGMHRLGFRPEETAAVYRRLRDCPAVGEIRWLTHLACADDRRDDTTPRQLEAFARAREAGRGEASIANSAATLAWPSAHADWVRPGICLYGASPFIDGGERPPLVPAMTLEARLIAVHRHHRGDRVGYGGTFTCPEDMPVGVVSIGYGDGYPRHAPNGTPVLVDGRRAALAGRVSMDMLCVDLRGHPGAAVGAPVTLWGRGLPAEEVAGRCGTIAYELFCRLTPRVTFREE
ncbi:alanine racemase [Arhodomonas aquaeolei]|uniref:alanine racemase n=1 Tax=Arhodomonas aquaeolei TaxID=2369 RepID=UPI0003667CCE|nr:alanine racemase [Arhodomonas aquaeolei]MCS4505145.1 alanine racemase [Arhodomonas aquaeolei]